MSSKWTYEFIWWIVSFLIAILVILPIYTSIGTDFLFYIENVVSIFVFITLTRWIFLLRHTFFARNKKIKLTMIFLMIPLFFICYDNLVDFQMYIDENDIMTMLTSLSVTEQPKLGKYIRYEYIFFGTAAIMVVIFFPFRMVVSLWRQINKGTV